MPWCKDDRFRREHDAEEVVQETLLSVIEHLEGFRGESAFYTRLMLRERLTRLFGDEATQVTADHDQ